MPLSLALSSSSNRRGHEVAVGPSPPPSPRLGVCHRVVFFSPASFQRLQGEKEVLYNDSRSEPHSAAISTPTGPF